MAQPDWSKLAGLLQSVRERAPGGFSPIVAYAHRLGIRGRVIGLSAALLSLGAICVAVAVTGMSATHAKVNESHAAFTASQVERGAYEDWIFAEDSSANALAVFSLHDANKVLPGINPPQTGAQVGAGEWSRAQSGYSEAVSGVQWLVRHAPVEQVRVDATLTEKALARYEGYSQLAQRVSVDGDIVSATYDLTVANASSAVVVRSDFDAMGGALIRYANAISTEVGRGVSDSLILVLVIGLIALVAAALLTVGVIRSITSPVVQITRATEMLADGNVEGVVLDVQSRDEIGQMARALASLVAYRKDMAAAAREIAGGNLSVVIEPRSGRDVLGLAFADMRERIADLLQQISASSRTVGSASQQIARNGQQTGMAVGEIAHALGSVAQGAEIQVRSLAEAREVTEEVATASQSSAAEAQETASAARQTRAAAEEGTAAVERATEVMRAVQASSTEISRTIQELGATSQQIGGIVDTITAVTKQTNLLALNAAIEAARAGEQGRGFAVVADQVRELAEQSQRAAATIGGLVAQIQAETGTAVKVAVDGARQTEEGVATVAQAREAFLRIDAGVQDMNGRVERIASSIEQIASSGARMQDSVDEVLAVAEQSSASAQQVSATAENTSVSTQEIAASAKALAGTAHELETLVNNFTLA